MLLVDTHCHINMMVKKEFDVPLETRTDGEIQTIIEQASHNDVSLIINVGTSLVESKNCIEIAKQSSHVYAAVGIHPNDATSSWQADFKEIKQQVKNKEINKIVAIGECGLDMHYPDYNLQRQKDVFKAHIELALENNIPQNGTYTISPVGLLIMVLHMVYLKVEPVFAFKTVMVNGIVGHVVN